MMSKKHLVIDGMNVMFQYAAKYLTDTAEVFLENVGRMINAYRPDVIHICWEASENFRFAIFPAYKGTRDPNDELRLIAKEQAKLVRELLLLTSINQWDGVGGEGDDVVATVARSIARAGDFALVWSTDGDLRQLVTDDFDGSQESPGSGGKLWLLTPSALLVKEDGVDDRKVDVIYDVENVVAHVGCHPSRIPDVKALVGDDGDNVPGVPDFGKKRAAKLIEMYGSADAVLLAAAGAKARYESCKNSERARISEEVGMTERQADSLLACADQIPVALDLVTIREIRVWCLEKTRPRNLAEARDLFSKTCLKARLFRAASARTVDALVREEV